VTADPLRPFVEEVALFYERFGLPRMAGRILGWLLVCEPQQQTMAEMARALGGSKASMSTMTRLLLPLRLIERVRRPGERQDRFGIRPGLWAEGFRREVASYGAARAMYARGLDALAGRAAAARARLEDARDLYAFFEAEVPKVLARFEARRRGGGAAARTPRGQGTRAPGRGRRAPARPERA
jgi:hypothetical protein